MAHEEGLLRFEARRVPRGDGPGLADALIHVVRRKGRLTTPQDCEDHIEQYISACRAAVPEPHSAAFVPPRDAFVLAAERHLCAKQSQSPLLVAYADRYAMSSGTNWASAFAALYPALLDLEIQKRRAEGKDAETVWIVRDSAMAGILAQRLSAAPQVPDCGPCVDRLVAECCAYMLIGAPDRGFDCGRGATRITEDNLGSAIHAIESQPSKWLVSTGKSELGDRGAMPAGSKRCVVSIPTLSPTEARAYAFRVSTGELLGAKPVAYQSRDQTQPASLGVYEAYWSGPDKQIIVWDACVVGGAVCRRELYETRIKAAKEHFDSVAMRETDVTTVLDTRFAFQPIAHKHHPFLSDMLHENKGGVALVQRDVPCEFYGGSGCYVWRGPDLSGPLPPGQAYLVHAYGSVYCLAAPHSCVLERVGKRHGVHIADNGKAYLCEWCPGDGTWLVLKPAKRKQALSCMADLVGGPAIIVPAPGGAPPPKTPTHRTKTRGRQ